MSVLSELQGALATEHAIIYGYGLVGAQLSGRERDAARAALDAHRARRDELAERIRTAGAQPVAAAPAYAPATPVSDRAAALALAIRLEDASAAAAYALVRAAAGRDRADAVHALSNAASYGAGWRVALAPASPEVVTFPGTR